MGFGETDSTSSQSVSESKAEEASRQNSENIKLFLDDWAEQSFASAGALNALQDLYKNSEDSSGVAKEIACITFKLCIACAQDDARIALEKIPFKILYMAEQYAELPKMKEVAHAYIKSAIYIKN